MPMVYDCTWGYCYRAVERAATTFHARPAFARPTALLMGRVGLGVGVALVNRARALAAAAAAFGYASAPACPSVQFAIVADEGHIRQACQARRGH
jgi:hypothetical protein